MRAFILAAAALALIGAQPAAAQSRLGPLKLRGADQAKDDPKAAAKVDLLRYVPKPVGGWKSDGLFDDAGVFDRSRKVYQEYSRLGGKEGGVSVTLTRGALGGSALFGAMSKPRLGPDPEEAGRVTSEVDVSGAKGYLTYEAGNRSGRIEVRFGDCTVIVEGYEVASSELLAFARAMDAAQLTKL
ncbi:hypothetical protein [Caulobacter sp. 17J65-9]|uniref:hypothetical protein n=1 Tax=Caulobacter sp. 17J65-9 TaxID=2709382 RepID=UPI0013C76AE8|nr:hypothetical protein [Caulobacter sp. 17J65-9]NEX93680.1 hypothetical protein [Caulobacter sp. 17J65-9]